MSKEIGVNMTKIIQPRKLPGFNELSPAKQIQFDSMIAKIKGVFEASCFVPIDSPVLELSEILLAKSGGEIDKEIYRFTKGDTDMCMRYDFTVPLARHVAMNFDTLSFPFKRYQIGKNYRGERPQKGRFREFYQCDADIIGNEDLPLPADAECISLYEKCFDALGFDCIIEVSNRKILSGIIADIGGEQIQNQILTLLDKLDKIGKENVRCELVKLGLSEDCANKITSVGEVKGDIHEVVSALDGLCQNELFLQGLRELEELDAYLVALGVTKHIYNLSIIRGHNYYTGTVFEVYLKGHREFGALGGGGRYDDLASYYTERKLPGVGMSIGLSRLFDLFDENGLLPAPKKSVVEVNIIPLGETLIDCLKIKKQMLDAGIHADVAYENRSFKAKMKEANRREIPYVIVVGENEVNTGNFKLKNMQSGEETGGEISDIIKLFKK